MIGSIEIHGGHGEVLAETVSGKIEITGEEFDEVDASSVSGRVTFEGDLSEHASSECESHSGGVTLILSPDVSAEFDITTFSGSIQDGLHREKEKRTSLCAPGKESHVETGAGDAEVSASCFSGTVHLKKTK